MRTGAFSAGCARTAVATLTRLLCFFFRPLEREAGTGLCTFKRGRSCVLSTALRLFRYLFVFSSVFFVQILLCYVLFMIDAWRRGLYKVSIITAVSRRRAC